MKNLTGEEARKLGKKKDQIILGWGNVDIEGGNWVGPENFERMKKETKTEKKKSKASTAIITTDYAM